MILVLSRSQSLKKFITTNRGEGSHGQLGHNNSDDQLTPKKVEALADEVVVAVA